MEKFKKEKIALLPCFYTRLLTINALLKKNMTGARSIEFKN